MALSVTLCSLEPRSTAAGQMARDLVSFVVLQRQLGAVTGISKYTAGKNLLHPGRALAETTLGAIADFINDPSDPTLLHLYAGDFPSYQGRSHLVCLCYSG